MINQNCAVVGSRLASFFSWGLINQLFMTLVSGFSASFHVCVAAWCLVARFVSSFTPARVLSGSL